MLLRGVAACTVSLVYRVKTSLDQEKAWDAGVLMICNLVEMDVATIVSSTPGFSSFMRSHVLDSKLAYSLRSILGGAKANRSVGVRWVGDRDPNQPSTRGDGDARQPSQNVRYYELNESWLLNSRETLDIADVASAPTVVHHGNGVRVTRTTDVDQASRAHLKGYGRSRINHQPGCV
ncbi:hypothetical protein VMCG_04059 [Cytospora schulzeri]|uniref:Uncharacterized protein n=1 Tax=Cytospora schulzeri TaxID=448051 RepID=A0A423WTK0_9PEZI|nr:hypothetical protein VMCG_04059 [Valsa malicola]